MVDACQHGVQVQRSNWFLCLLLVHLFGPLAVAVWASTCPAVWSLLSLMPTALPYWFIVLLPFWFIVLLAGEFPRFNNGWLSLLAVLHVQVLHALAPWQPCSCDTMTTS